MRQMGDAIKCFFLESYYHHHDHYYSQSESQSVNLLNPFSYVVEVLVDESDAAAATPLPLWPHWRAKDWEDRWTERWGVSDWWERKLLSVWGRGYHGPSQLSLEQPDARLRAIKQEDGQQGAQGTAGCSQDVDQPHWNNNNSGETSHMAGRGRDVSRLCDWLALGGAGLVKAQCCGPVRLWLPNWDWTAVVTQYSTPGCRYSRTTSSLKGRMTLNWLIHTHAE